MAGPAGAVAGSGAYITVTTSTPVTIYNPITVNTPISQSNVQMGGGGSSAADIWRSRPRVVVVPVFIG